MKSNRAETFSFKDENRRLSESCDANNGMDIPPLMSPSTDTTLSTITTKIEDQPNETEILLIELSGSSDVDANVDSNDDANTDDESVVSSASSVSSRYFERTDFLPWEELYSKAEYAPHVGFAMVAGGFACLHPLVFFAGVVTAVGAARAAGATYEYACMQQQKRRKGLEGDDSSADDFIIPCDCVSKALGFNDTSQSEILKEEGSKCSPRYKLHHERSLPTLGKSSTCSTKASTIGDQSYNANNRTNLSCTSDLSVPLIINPSIKNQKTFEEDFDPARWVADKFPTLPIIALENVEFRGLNAHEFFDVFFADDAPFGFPAFHILRRDKEVQYSPWNATTNKDNPESNNIEFHSSINTKERAVQYHAKTNSFLGPAYAPTKKIQRAYFVSKTMLVIEINMTLHDIPFSKHFHLVERWVVDGTRCGFGRMGSFRKKKRNQQRLNHNNGGGSTKASSAHCVYLTVSSEVYFTQECAFENAVRKESTKQVCEISKCWNAMAQAGLKRTEETRSKRLRQEEEEKLNFGVGSPSRSQKKLENHESIEIEHVDNHAVYDQSRNQTSASKKRLSIRNRRRSSSSYQTQKTQQPDRRRRRSFSQSFSKLRVRGGNSNIDGESDQKPSLNVRISSAGVTSC